MEQLPKGAKFDDIQTELLRSAPFSSCRGLGGQPKIVGLHRVNNPVLESLYDSRRTFSTQMQGFALEKELWHGTNCKALKELLTHGLQPPSDTKASPNCPVSGNKGLCTTLCDSSCPHCTEPHVWDKCHMYGLGVYLADQAQKSHRYVREPEVRGGKEVYTLIRCRVNLGNPYLIEGHLLKPDAMHNFVWCQNPSDCLERSVEEWSVDKGHEAFYVRGLAENHKAGYGVYNSEYIVFQPYQILPLYLVEYTLE